MTGAAFCIAVSLIGIDVGCRRMPDGTLQYIVQIDPQQFESIRSGEYAIESELPDWLKDVRSYRVCVGTGKVPRDDLAPSPRPLVSSRYTRPEPAAPSLPTTLPGGRPVSDPDYSPPRPLSPDPFSKPVPEKPQPAKQAASLQSQAPDSSTPPKPAFVDEPDDGPQKSHPWLPLTLAVTGFCGSLGGNLYLGMLFWDARRRYRALLGKRYRGEATPWCSEVKARTADKDELAMDDLDR